MAEGEKLSATGRLIVGLLLIVAGLFPALAAFDIGPMHADRINGPPWLGLAGGGVFMAGGMALVLLHSAPLLQQGFAALTVLCMGTIANWIAFGAGERACSGSVALLWFAADGRYSDLGCRIPFGFMALLVNAFLIYMVAKIAQQALGGPPRLAGMVKLGQGLMLLVLMPLLLPLLLFLVVKGTWSAFRRR